MREELEQTFYTATPVTSIDTYNHRGIDGYADLYEHHGLIVENEERKSMEEYGYRPNYSIRVFMDADTNSIKDNDGLYTSYPTHVGYYYPDPPYIVEGVRTFGNKVIIDARKQ